MKQYLVWSIMLFVLSGCIGGGRNKNLAEGASGDIMAYQNEAVNAIEQARPLIMVLPSDLVLQNFGLLKNVKQSGKQYSVRDYASWFIKDDRAKRILSEIQGQFIAQGYPLNDLEQTLKQLDTQEATDLADGLDKDTKTQLLTVAQPDIILELNYTTSRDKGMSMTGHNYNVSAQEKDVNYSLNAIDAYTNKVIATISADHLKGDSTTEAIKEDLKKQMPSFMKAIQASFSETLTRGRDVIVRIALEKDCNINLDDISVEGDTYADYIDDYLKTHTVKGAYKLQRNTARELYYVNVRIPLLNEGGTQFGVYDWSRDFARSLRKDLGLTVSNKAQGLGEILVSIKGI